MIGLRTKNIEVGWLYRDSQSSNGIVTRAATGLPRRSAG
jgi:hypothetical protein